MPFDLYIFFIRHCDLSYSDQLKMSYYYVVRWVEENSASVVPGKMISEENIVLDQEVSVVQNVKGKMKVYRGTVLSICGKLNLYM